MADTAVQQVIKEPLFSKKNRRLISDPLNDNNPITVQVLGICSALAITTQVIPSVVMAIAVIFVMALSSLTISLLRTSIPKQVRMIVMLIVIATLVTIVELTLKAILFETYKQLSVFIGLIITNCIIMGRLEAFAMANKPWQSTLDAIGNALGYGAILILVGVSREFFGSGSLAGFMIIGPADEFLIDTSAGWGETFFSWYMNNNLMVLPPGALFVIGIVIWIQRNRNQKLVDIS
jgi:Na+-transporting NADH:ubiquinone oxidoreductase subunit D